MVAPVRFYVFVLWSYLVKFVQLSMFSGMFVCCVCAFVYIVVMLVVVLCVLRLCLHMFCTRDCPYVLEV